MNQKENEETRDQGVVAQVCNPSTLEDEASVWERPCLQEKKQQEKVVYDFNSSTWEAQIGRALRVESQLVFRVNSMLDRAT